MGYDHGDSFPFDFEPNGIQFRSKSKGKLSPRSYPIQYERKWKYSFLSEGDTPVGPAAPQINAVVFRSSNFTVSRLIESQSGKFILHN